MVQHALHRSYEIVDVCREKIVGKLDAFADRITIIPGVTDDATSSSARWTGVTVC
jgi:hypothetical protein